MPEFSHDFIYLIKESLFVVLHQKRKKKIGLERNQTVIERSNKHIVNHVYSI